MKTSAVSNSRTKSKSPVKSSRPSRVWSELLERRMLLSGIPFITPALTQLGASAQPIGMATGDFNGDGKADLVVPEVAGASNRSDVLLSNGDGTFHLGQSIDYGLAYRLAPAVAVGDFNGDGRLDIAQAAERSDLSGGAVLVSLGNGDGTFQAPVAYNVRSAPSALVAGKFHGTSTIDLVAATAAVNGSSDLALDVLSGNGDGTFTLTSDTPMAQALQSLAVGDFNGDGKLDLATPAGIQLGNGDGTFAAATAWPNNASGLGGVAAGDFNGDGKLDVALAPLGAGQGAGVAGVTILLGNGDGTFTTGTSAAVGSLFDVTGFTAADLDGDGHTDLVLSLGPSNALHPNSIAVLQGVGDGTFNAPEFITPSAAPAVLAVADLAGHVRLDIADAGPAAVSALIDASTTPLVSKVVLTTSNATIASGASAQVTATVTGGGANTPLSGGTLTFFDGTTAIGRAALTAGGKAILTTSALSTGTHSITAMYSGVGQFAASTSQPLNLTVSPGATSPLPQLSASIASLTLPSVFVPGDKGKIKLTLTDTGAKAFAGRVGIDLFASSTGAIDSSSVQIAAPSLASRTLRLKSLQSVTISAPITTSIQLPAGSYQMLANVVALSNIPASELPAAPAAAPAAVQAVTEFGVVGSRRNVRLTQPNPAGGTIAYSLVGPGTGVVSASSTGVAIAVTGATAATRITLAPRGAAIALQSLSIAGALGAFVAPAADLDGTLSATGAIGQLTLRSLNNATVTASSIGTLRVIGAITSSRVLAGANVGADGVLGTSDDTFAAGRLNSVNIGGAVTGSLIAAGLDPVDGIFLNGNDVLLPGGRIGALTIGGALDPTSHVVAAALPKTVKVGGVKLAPIGDARFMLAPLRFAPT